MHHAQGAAPHSARVERRDSLRVAIENDAVLANMAAQCDKAVLDPGSDRGAYLTTVCILLCALLFVCHSLCVSLTVWDLCMCVSLTVCFTHCVLLRVAPLYVCGTPSVTIYIPQSLISPLCLHHATSR